MKKTTKLLAFLMALCMTLSLSVFASGEASSEASGEASGDSGRYIITFTPNSNFPAWEDVGCHYWGEATNGTEWPGETMTKSNGSYSIAISPNYEPLGLVFNDATGAWGDGVQTIDLTFASDGIAREVIMKDGVTVIGMFTVSGYTADKAGWKQYLKDYVSAVPAARDHLDEFYEAIDAGAFDTKPGDMLFTDVYWGYSAVTLDAFLAAGGAVDIPTFDPMLQADAEP